mgnify:CR=1 FL=1
MSFNNLYFELDNNKNENYNLLENKVTKKSNDTKKLSKGKKAVNNFPLAWTCYKKNGKYICPMRGDKEK